MTEKSNRILILTTEIAAAFLGAKAVGVARVAGLIRDIHQSLIDLEQGHSNEPDVVRSTPKAAVDIRKSVFPGHLICLEEGMSVKTLKRHLKAAHGMTPVQDRAKWGLPENYPMIAPDYTRLRSTLARKSGLGKRR